LVARLTGAALAAALAVGLTGACGGSSEPTPVRAQGSTIADREVPPPTGPALLCKLPPGAKKLPATRRHGLVQHLRQYPDVSLATPSERARARGVLAQLVSASEEGNWRDLKAVERAGYDTRTAPRKPGDRSIHYFHAERPAVAGGVGLDFRRPKALIFANAPGRPLALVGAMWSTGDGERGATPAGPIMRWHSHVICLAKGKRRGTKPPASGRCPAGSQLRQGRREMLHVWFTRDLRSAFAIRAPEPELCAAGLLPEGHCRGIGRPPQAAAIDRRSPTRAELTRSVEAAFTQESYLPGTTATLVISNRASGIRMRIFRSGPERVSTRSTLALRGIPVSRTRPVGTSRGKTRVDVAIGDWPSGLYFARLRAADGRVGFAPFVVRPRMLGEHAVAVVLPTLTWQAYNLRDDDGNGRGDSWYASWKTKTVRLGRPYLSRGVPYSFRRDVLPFLHWLARSGKEVDVLSQSDLESAVSPRALRDAYELIVFPGHHEYVTTSEYDLVEGYRDLGGNLMFLSANNFYWQVVKRNGVMTRTTPWRDLGRPEAALIGVQYVANGRGGRPWIVRSSSAASWIFDETGLEVGWRLALGGIEIDKISAASPPGVEVLAEIPNLFGTDRTAQMTFYETESGARVFAAGAFYVTRLVDVNPVTSRMLENLWERLSRD
jgi:N,N-dimethylformamidase beta subunit-like, C-terminal